MGAGGRDYSGIGFTARFRDEIAKGRVPTCKECGEPSETVESSTGCCSWCDYKARRKVRNGQLEKTTGDG